MSKFTSLISSVVNNSSGDLKSGVENTFKKLSDYLENAKESIELIVGENIEDCLYIERFGDKIFLKDILINAKESVSNVGKNFVSFGLGDILGTTDKGTLSISIDGYTVLKIYPNSKVKISEIGNNLLSYENLNGTTKYDFLRNENFTYKVKGKNSYATIRGTTLKVETKNNKDTYNLISGKVKIYDEINKKTFNLEAPTSITI